MQEEIIANAELSLDGPNILRRYRTRDLQASTARLEKLSGIYPLTSSRSVLVGEPKKEDLPTVEAEVKTEDWGVFEYVMGLKDIEKQPPQIFATVTDDYNALRIFKGDNFRLRIRDE